MPKVATAVRKVVTRKGEGQPKKLNFKTYRSAVNLGGNVSIPVPMPSVAEARNESQKEIVNRNEASLTIKE